jgi:hypothetical protein
MVTCATRGFNIAGSFDIAARALPLTMVDWIFCNEARVGNQHHLIDEPFSTSKSPPSLPVTPTKEFTEIEQTLQGLHSDVFWSMSFVVWRFFERE